jgi:hypothetical protein
MMLNYLEGCDLALQSSNLVRLLLDVLLKLGDASIFALQVLGFLRDARLCRRETIRPSFLLRWWPIKCLDEQIQLAKPRSKKTCKTTNQ